MIKAFKEKECTSLGGVVRVVVKNCLCVSVVKLEVFFLFWVLAVPIVTQRFRECFPGGRWTIFFKIVQSQKFIHVFAPRTVGSTVEGEVDDRNI